MALVLAAGPTGAFPAEVSEYYASMKDICRTGVTPAMTAAYERARRALEQARAAGPPGTSRG